MPALYAYSPLPTSMSISAETRTQQWVAKQGMKRKWGVPQTNLAGVVARSTVPVSTTGMSLYNVALDTTALPALPALPAIPSTSPPLPPNWNEHLEDTIISLSSYKLFPVPSDTLEYATLAAMLNPFQITSAEQIVNPTLVRDNFRISFECNTFNNLTI